MFPLHSAKTRQDVLEALAAGADVNAKNSEGLSALMASAQDDGKIQAFVQILNSEGIDLEVKDSHGATVLHHAAYYCHEDMVMGLLCSGAKGDVLDKCPETAWTCAVAAEADARKKGKTDKEQAKRLKILEILQGLGANFINPGEHAPLRGFPAPAVKTATKEENAEEGDYQLEYEEAKEAKEVRSAYKKGARILSLDGGGIRGLVICQLLMALEEAAGKQIVDMFDIIGGTSIGGIIALALTHGKTTLQIQRLLFTFKDEVFVGNRPYEEKKLEALLMKTFGEQTMLGLQGPKVLVTTTKMDSNPGKLKWYRTFQGPKVVRGLLQTEEDVSLVKAARATGAAPGYFNPVDNLGDGGLVANNPSSDLLTEISCLNSALQAAGRNVEKINIRLFVSLGTGTLISPKTTTAEGLKVETPFDYLSFVLNALHVKNLVLSTLTDSNGQVVKESRSRCKDLGIPFFRFSPMLKEEVALDETDNAKLLNLMYLAKKYAIHCYEDFKSIADVVRQ